MKALSIRQPWAWLIIHGGKDIENRTWLTKYRGRILVHASQGMSRPEYEAAKIVADTNNAYMPDFENLKRGGIIGSVVELKPRTVVLKVDESSNTRITFSRDAIQQVLDQSADAAPATPATADKGA